MVEWLYCFQENTAYPEPIAEIAKLGALEKEGKRPYLLLSDRASPPMSRAGAGDRILLCAKLEGGLVCHGEARVVSASMVHDSVPDDVRAIYGETKGRQFIELSEVRVFDPRAVTELAPEELAKFIAGQAYVKRLPVQPAPRLTTYVGERAVPDTQRVSVIQAVQEILDFIIEDQWERRSSDRLNWLGYRLGAVLLVPPDELDMALDSVKRPSSKAEAGVASAYVRASLGAPHGAQANLEKAKTSLRNAGGDPDAIIDYLQRKAEGPFPSPSVGQLEAFADVLNAFVAEQLTFGEDSDLVERCKDDVRAAREKLFLTDFQGRYPKILERAERLEPLAVADDGLHEAHRTYLYGFYRSSVILSWVACEVRIKKVIGQPDAILPTEELLSRAELARALPKDGPTRKDLNAFAQLRNKAVHRGYSPQAQEAETALYWARDLLEFLANR